LYALALNNNPNYVDRAKNITIVDRRNDIVNPSTIVERAVSSYFTIQDTPYANWRSTISVSRISIRLGQESPIFISELQWMYCCTVCIVKSC
jgi:hypothetical protein